MSEEKKNLEQLFKEEIAETISSSIELLHGGEFKLTTCQQTQTLPSPLPPYNFTGVQHKIESAPALAGLLQRLSEPGKAIVYHNDKYMVAVLDRTVCDRPVDTAKYEFEPSDQAKDWVKVFDERLSQKEFIKFLKAREDGEIDASEKLMAAAQEIKGNFKVVSEQIYVDNNNLGLVYKIEQDGKVKEGQMTLPTRLQVIMPLLKESETEFIVDIDLELTIPVDGQRPFFVLSCPRWNAFWRQAVNNAVSKLRDELPEYLIVAGTGLVKN